MYKCKTVIIFVICFLFSTCAWADDNRNEYAFILKARGNPYWQILAAGIADTAKVQKLSQTTYFLSSDDAAEEQLNLCETVLARKPKIIVIAAANPAMGLQCMKAAVANGIMVADVDANVSLEDAKKENVPLAFTIGSDNYLIGKKAAQYVADNAKNKSSKIFILEGAAGNIPGLKRAMGFKDEIKKQMPDAVIIASIRADWDRLRAMNATNDILQRSPDLDVIYAANDTMALGAVEALRAQTRKNNIMILGVDGTSDARDAVMAGHLQATIAQLPYLMGKSAVENAMAAIAGEKIDIVQITPTPIVDKKFLTEKKDSLAQYIH